MENPKILAHGCFGPIHESLQSVHPRSVGKLTRSSLTRTAAHATPPILTLIEGTTMHTKSLRRGSDGWASRPSNDDSRWSHRPPPASAASNR